MRRLMLSTSFALAVACGGGGSTVAPAEDQPAANGTAVVWPDEDFRSERPAVGPPVEVKAPGIQTFALANGIDVYLVERHDLPVVSMTLRFQVGSMSDPRGKEGLAAVAMDLMDESTKKLDKIAFGEKKADLASNVYAGSGDEESYVGMSTLRRNLDPTLDLLVEVMSSPGMRKDDLDRIIESRKASIQQAKGSPSRIGGRLWDSVVYGPNHPYGKVRTEKAYDRIKLSDCKRYVSRLGPKGARLFVVGDITKAEIEDKVGSRLASWHKGKTSKGRKPPAAKPRKGTIFFVDVPGAAQSQVYVGHPGPVRTAEDYEATALMGRILGGGFTSRINMNIREDKGYAYGARAGFSYTKHTGTFRASSSVRTDVTGPSLREIAKEIANMRASDPTAEELQREQNAVLLAMPARFATASRIMGSYSNLVFYGLPLDWYEGHQKRVTEAKIADLRKAAETHLQATDFKVLVVGDGAVVREDLEAIAAEGIFGKGGVVELDADGKVLKSKKPAKPAKKDAGDGAKKKAEPAAKTQAKAAKKDAGADEPGG